MELNLVKKNRTYKFLASLLLAAGCYFVVVTNLFIEFQSKMPFNERPELYLAFFLLILIVSTLFVFYVFNGNVMEGKRSRMMFSMMVLIIVCLEINVLMGIVASSFLRPYILVSILTFALYKQEKAFFAGLFLVIMTMIYDLTQGVVGEDHMAIMFLLGLNGVLMSTFFSQKSNFRISLIFVGLKVGLITFASAFSLTLLFDFPVDEALLMSLFAFLSAMISVALFLIMLPIFEIITKATTIYRLYELCDSSRGLIKRMKEDAPGTFNHSLIVANLAEACANKIGVDPQLARAAALYHDIGKLSNPEYFGENQKEYNPHDDINPDLSRDIIKLHSRNGYDLCIANHIPPEIANVCIEHHGTLPIEFFYHKAKKLTEGSLKINEFCYDGPKPQSKISAIILIADGCEAAIRATDSKDIAKIEETARKIIENRINHEQFSECSLTFKDVNDIKDAIVANYTGIYHDRIKYPKVKISKEEK